MKRLLFALIFALALLSVASCSKGEDHTHRRTRSYKFDDQYHWYPCQTNDCTHQLEKAQHNFNEGTVTKRPTSTSDGIKTFVCIDCKYSKEIVISKNDVKNVNSYEWKTSFSGSQFRNVTAKIVETIKMGDKTYKTEYNIQGNESIIYVTIVKYVDGKETEYTGKYQEGNKLWVMDSRDKTIEDVSYTFNSEMMSLAKLLKDWNFDLESEYSKFAFYNGEEYIGKNIGEYKTVRVRFAGGKMAYIEGFDGNESPERTVTIEFSKYGETKPSPPTKATNK